MSLYQNILSFLFIALSAFLLTACGGGGSGTPENQTEILPAVVNQEVVDNITSVDSFKGVFGEGFVFICPGTETTGQPRNFLFTVHGFAPNTVNRIPKAGELQNTCDSLPTNRNYHVFKARYRNGGDYIQRNAGFIRELLTWAMDKYKITTADRVAVVGKSMGGLVSRYALQSMQVAGVENKVDLFITVDSPHYGAYTPIGVQALANAFSAFGGNTALNDAKSSAAKQMLRYHYTQGSAAQTWTNDFQQLYIDELEGALGGFPSASDMRTVAVSSARGDGQMSSPAAKQRYYGGYRRYTTRYTIPEKTEGNSVCTVTFKKTPIDIDVDLSANAYALGLVKGATQKIASTDVKGYVVILKPDGTRSSRVSLDSTGTTLPNYIKGRISESFGCGAINTTPYINAAVKFGIDEAIKQGRAKAKPYVAAFQNKSYTTINDGSTSEGVPGGLGFDIATLRSTMVSSKFIAISSSGTSLANSHSFITLGSALGIKDLDPVAATNLQLSDLTIMSPFDQIYYEPNKNLDHLKTTSGWFLKEVTALFDK